jgi:hypothetical protein
MKVIFVEANRNHLCVTGVFNAFLLNYMSL